jgi:hypothetical protein
MCALNKIEQSYNPTSDATISKPWMIKYNGTVTTGYDDSQDQRNPSYMKI